MKLYYSPTVELSSETLLPPLTLAISTLEKNLSSFVVVGRVSDMENILLFIEAPDADEAGVKFLETVKIEQDWDGSRDIYIEFCIPLSQYRQNNVYNDTETALSFYFD